MFNKIQINLKKTMNVILKFIIKELNYLNKENTEYSIRQTKSKLKNKQF